MALVITSVEDLRSYVRSDLARYDDRSLVTMIKLPQARFLVRLRVTEWWCNSHPRGIGRLLGAFLKQRLQAAGTRLGYTIPVNVVGPGLRLPHVGTIVLSGAARVGANCQLLQGVTLGAYEGGAPSLGSDVYLAPNVSVIGPRTIGDGAWVGAGSVVTSDIPAREVWAGVPARRLRRRD